MIKMMNATLIVQEKKEITSGNTNSRIADIFQILENENLNLTEYDELHC